MVMGRVAEEKTVPNAVISTFAMLPMKCKGRVQITTPEIEKVQQKL